MSLTTSVAQLFCPTLNNERRKAMKKALKYINKAVSVLLCVILVISCIPITTLASSFPHQTANISASGENENCVWNYDSETKTLYLDAKTIKGYNSSNGSHPYLPAYTVQSSGSILYCYTGFEHLVFGKNVEEIVDIECTRGYYPSLKTIEFEEGSALKFVGDYTFSESSVESVTLPSGVEEIGYSAFASTEIREITIPASVKKLNDFAFSSPKLESIVFEPRDTMIEYHYAPFAETAITSFDFNECYFDGDTVPDQFFTGCGNLTSVTLTDKITKVGPSAFYSCYSLESFNFGNIVSIGINAFENTGLTSVEAEKVTELGDGAFMDCTLLSSVSIPNCTYISSDAFYNCSLLDGFDFSNVEYVCDSAFEDTSISQVNSETILELGWGAFRGCTNLVSVDVPNCTYIGDYAFISCQSLESVNVPKITVINDNTFSNTYKLTEFDFGNITSIGRYAFKNGGIESFNAPNVTSIGYQAFYNATSLKEVTFGDKLTTIGTGAFINCSDTEFSAIPDSVTSVGEWAFQNSGIRQVHMKAGTSYGKGAFSNCTRLTSATMDEHVTFIPDNTFDGCTSLKEVIVYPYVSTVGAEAFANCTSLERVVFTKFYFSAGARMFKNSNPVLYGANGSTAYKYARSNDLEFKAKGSGDLSDELEALIQEEDEKGTSSGTWKNGTWEYNYDKTVLYINGTGELVSSNVKNSDGTSATSFAVVLGKSDSQKVDVVIGEGITSISSSSNIGNSKQIGTLSLPDSLTAIGQDTFYNAKIDTVDFGSGLTMIDQRAFYGCQLKQAYFPGDSKLEYIGDFAFYDNRFEDFNFPKSVTHFGASSLYGAKYTEIDLTGFSPDTFFGSQLFRYCPITKVDFGNVKTLGAYMFANTKIESVEIPSTVERLGDYAFVNCNSLKTVVLPDSISAIPDNCFYGCKVLDSINLDNIVEVGVNAFAYCSAIVNVSLPNMMRMGKGAFLNCNYLQSASMPKMTYLPENAFRDCTRLEGVSVPLVTTIGKSAFESCDKYDGLERDFNIEQITAIGTNAFRYTGITSVHMYDYIEYGDSCFELCNNLTEVTVDSGVEVIPTEMFYKCGNLKTVNIDNDGALRVIKTGAFYNCDDLEYFLAPKNLETIEEYAFNYCYGLKTVVLGNKVSYIGSYAFDGCRNLKYAVIAKHNVNLTNAFETNFSNKNYPVLTIISGINSTADEYCRENAAQFVYCNGDEYIEEFSEDLGYVAQYNTDGTYNIEQQSLMTYGTWENGVWEYSADLQNLYFRGTGTLTDTLVAATGESMRFDDIVAKGNGNIKVYIGYGITAIGDGFAQDCENTDINSLVLEAGVESIGNNAFDGVEIYALTLDSALETIGDYAFNSCNIANVYNNSQIITSIGDYAFANNRLNNYIYCDTLKEIGAHAYENNKISTFTQIGTDITIGDYAFAGNKIENVTLSTANKFGNYVFANSTAIKLTATVEDGIEKIPNGVFCGCTGLKEIVIPQSVKIIGDGAFSGTSIPSVAFGDNIEQIGSKAYYDCYKLEKVEISENVKSIGSAAFGKCIKLGQVVFNNETASIYADTVDKSKAAIGFDEYGTINPYTVIYAKGNSTAFEYASRMGVNFSALDIDGEFSGYIASSLKDIELGNCVTWVYYENTDSLFIYGKTLMKGDFYDRDKVLMSAPPTASKIVIASGVTGLYTSLAPIGASEVVIPVSVGAIERAFKNCDRLEYLNIPDSVTEITSEAFMGCTSLKSLSIGKGVKKIPKSMADGCVNLKFLYIYGARTIGEFAFRSCSSLSTISLPDTVEEIRQNAFEKCLGVFKVQLGANVRKIGSRAFADLPLLDTVEYSGNIGFTDETAFDNSSSATSGMTVILGDEVQSGTLGGYKNAYLKRIEIGRSFEGFSYRFDALNLEEFVVSDYNEHGLNTYDGCLYIGTTLCAAPQNRDSIEIKQGTTAIGDEAFSSCKVNIIKIPDSVATIGNYSFSNAKQLKAVRMSNGIESIGEYAFYGCEKLKTVSIPTTCRSIGKCAFKACSRLASVNMSEGLLTIGKDCFSQTVIDSVVVPRSVTFVDSGAFGYNDKLTAVYIWDSELGYNVFNNSSPTVYTMASSPAYAQARQYGISYSAYTDEELFTQICLEAREIISGYLGYCADGHGDIEWLTVYEGDCEHDGYEIGVCEYCSEILDERHYDAEGHRYCQVAYIEESETDYGIRVLKCNKCAQIYTVYYEPLGEYVPSVGVYTVSGKIEADNGRFVNYEDTAIENADIFINGALVASTDENGHFRFKMKSGSYIMEIRYAYGFTRYVGLSITDHDIVLDDKQAIKMIACDFNKDGKIDAADQSLFTLVIFSKKGDASYLKFVDLNNDGCINAKDYIIIEKLIGTDSLTYSYPELTIA